MLTTGSIAKAPLANKKSAKGKHITDFFALVSNTGTLNKICPTIIMERVITIGSVKSTPYIYTFNFYALVFIEACKPLTLLYCLPVPYRKLSALLVSDDISPY
ncbi:hypothetical protein GCM10007978_29850 [Shewanella hanedai]|nr:hypothetical protein GCM10007978_29850 [Shewanella hanedai]